MRKEDVKRRVDEIFGRGSRDDIRMATTMEKMAERIEEMSKREEQFETWEMRLEAKRKQRDDKRLNVF